MTQHQEHTQHAAHEQHEPHSGHAHADHSMHAASDSGDHGQHAAAMAGAHGSHAEHLVADTARADGEVAVHGSAHAAHHGAGGHNDHSGHAGHSAEMFARPFWISLILTVPVLVYGMFFQELLGYTAPRFPGSAYLPLVLSSIIY